jgi:hypothetical protein
MLKLQLLNGMVLNTWEEVLSLKRPSLEKLVLRMIEMEVKMVVMLVKVQLVSLEI